jgi:tetraacyldisaccharide 4'-kinase
MRAPEFWTRRGLASGLLLPLAWGHAGIGAVRRSFSHPWRAPVPVVCVGNLVAGGAGKTPVALSLAARLTAQGRNPHLLSRGYGGKLPGPIRVEPARHSAAEIGDEALLLAAVAPSWVARDRAAGARAAIAAGAGMLVLDDGLQNTSLVHDLAFLVIDGGYGFGNGRVMPAGPLREPVSTGLARADAVVLVGEDQIGLRARLGDTTVLRARLVPRAATDLLEKPVVAFAGIGRPAKFFATLEGQGARLLARHAFPDHHVYAEAELGRLCVEAGTQGAVLITTAKDAARLSPSWRAQVRVLAVDVAWEDEVALAAMLARLASTGHG